MADDRSASMLELMAIDAPHGHYDVAILGGGLAGLTLALQLKRERPETRVLVTDKRTEPAPEAAFKVGESSVEIGAYYYREVVGMRDHLEKYQQRKLGLRFFLPAGDNSDITKRVEFCTPGHLDAFTHQIDRGRFENEAFRRCRKAGADAFRGWRVQDVEIGPDKHTVHMSQEDETCSVTARWIVDATGRANILRRKLNLGSGAETGHHANAAWIRLAGGLDFEDWTDDEEWLGRMPEKGLRIHSTSHLIQPGYWLWLIQLASGPISIGVCADPRFHPWDEINSFDAFMEWMKRNEPQLHAEIDGRREDVLDFLRVQDFSYGSTRFFSPDRWTLVGEAGGFLDALYSPGSDFIGFSNTYSAELIERELDGEDVTDLVEFYNDFYLSLFNTTAHLYRDNYQLFGNPQVMVAKFVYDSSTYFTGIGNAWCHDKMRKPEDIRKLREALGDAVEMLPVMQQLFRDWNALEQTPFEGVSVLPKQLAPYIAAQADMAHPAEGDEVFENTRKNVQYLKALAVWIFHRAARNLPEPPDENRPINPLAISLHPERWEADGLYSDDGISLVQALEMLPGIEEMDLEARGAVVAA
jgi:flavin-dependent dehydrogenase